MTVRDLYLNTDENQIFIMRLDSNPKKIVFKGKLKDCPICMVDVLVHKFWAIDFNTIVVFL